METKVHSLIALKGANQTQVAALEHQKSQATVLHHLKCQTLENI